MDTPVIISGTYSNGAFEPSGPVPDVEGPAELIVNAHDSPPKTLYHYCGVDAFFGIVTSKVIWLSSAYFTNDYSEHRLVMDKAVERLKAITNEDNRKHNELLLRWLQDRTIHPHVACFSLEPDLLSQWRAYCGDGKGFAIGFSVDVLEGLLKEFELQGILIVLRPVSYETEEQEKVLDHFLKEYQTVKPGAMQDADSWPSVVLPTFSSIWRIAAVSKNHGFYEECEYRILLMPLFRDDKTTGSAVPDAGTSPLQFRLADRGIIPYFTFPFPESAITEIILGPKNYARENVEALKSFLRTNGYNVGNMKIIPSEVTYQ